MLAVVVALAWGSSACTKDSPDAAIGAGNDDVLEAIEEAATSELRSIEHALERIDAGTFALCENCGRGISAARLRAVPHATLCLEC